jgi:hypothetical protein
VSTPLPNSRANRAVQAQTGLRRWVQVTLTRAGTSVTLEPTALRLTQDSRRSMRWDGSLTVADPSLAPTRPQDLLAPFGTRVSVQLGVELLDGTISAVPYGQFMATATRVGIQPDSQITQLTLLDLAETIERYRFEEPLTIVDGTDLAAMVNAVVTSRIGVNPNIPSTGRLLGADRVFGLSPETGPWSEVQDVLNGFGLTAWFDRSGQVQIGTLDVSSANAVQLPGVTSLTADFDTRPYNVVVVRGEPLDSPPVFSIAMDEDPGSPTYAGTSPGSSPYGRVTKFYTSQLIYTQQQADDAAAQMLQEEIGGGASWSGARGYDPTLDPMDVYNIAGQVLAVDAVTVDVTGETSIQFRTLA